MREEEIAAGGVGYEGLRCEHTAHHRLSDTLTDETHKHLSGKTGPYAIATNALVPRTGPAITPIIHLQVLWPS